MEPKLGAADWLAQGDKLLSQAIPFLFCFVSVWNTGPFCFYTSLCYPQVPVIILGLNLFFTFYCF